MPSAEGGVLRDAPSAEARGRFQCLRCDECCTFSEEWECPVVFPWEKRRLEELAEARGVELEFKPLDVWRLSDGRCIVVLYRWVIRGTCPFHERGFGCTIHEEKPLACKLYPLLVEVPSGRLMVSGKCRWVEERREWVTRLKPEEIPRIFPAEFEAAKQVLIHYTSAMEVLSGAEKVEPSACRELVDLDRYALEG